MRRKLTRWAAFVCGNNGMSVIPPGVHSRSLKISKMLVIPQMYIPDLVVNYYILWYEYNKYLYIVVIPILSLGRLSQVLPVVAY